MAQPEPRVVGPYAIFGEIASGGMASVHFARLIDPGGPSRIVAIKRAHPHLVRETDFALMFLDEARLASRIQHANVASTIDVLSTPEDLALVMEYVHGESLWKLMREVNSLQKRVPLSIATAIVTGTLHGLHAAHEATDDHGAPLRIVHRDVSPQNIMVGADGVPRLVDFGIAKAAGRLHSTHDNSVKGKYAYMSPEQARGEGVSRVTDTYAAAIVFWELLTGERLFAGKTEAETIHKCLVARAQAPSLFAPDLPKAIDGIVKQGLSRDPRWRYQTAREMALDIERSAPVATADEVAAWVESTAGGALAARAEMLRQIERHGVRDEPAAPAREVLATDPSMPSLEPTTKRVEPARTRPRKRPLTLGFVTGAVVAAAVTAVVALKAATPVLPGQDRPASSPLETPLATTANAEGGVAPSTPGTAGPVAVAPESLPLVAPTPWETVPVPSATPIRSSARPPVRPARGGTPPRGAAPHRPGCDPPYSIDAQGRQIFKPECM